MEWISMGVRAGGKKEGKGKGGGVGQGRRVSRREATRANGRRAGAEQALSGCVGPGAKTRECGCGTQGGRVGVEDKTESERMEEKGRDYICGRGRGRVVGETCGAGSSETEGEGGKKAAGGDGRWVRRGRGDEGASKPKERRAAGDGRVAY